MSECSLPESKETGEKRPEESDREVFLEALRVRLDKAADFLFKLSIKEPVPFSNSEVATEAEERFPSSDCFKKSEFKASVLSEVDEVRSWWGSIEETFVTSESKLCAEGDNLSGPR